MVKVKATRGFLSPVYGDVIQGQVLTVSRKMAEQMMEVSAVTMVETYDTKVVAPVPLVSAPPAQSQSLPAAPAPTEKTPTKRARKARSSSSTTQ
jgi:hypothetical protein